MHRIDGPGATAGNLFTEGNPATSVPATTVTDDWLNDIQEELMTLLTNAGITPVKGVQNQVLQAIQFITGTFTTPPQFDNDNSAATTAFVQRALGSISGYTVYTANQAIPITDAGKFIASNTASNITLTLPAGSSVVVGTRFTFANANTGTTTIAANGADTINYLGIGSPGSAVLAPSNYISVIYAGSGAWTSYEGSWNFSGLGSKPQFWQDVKTTPGRVAGTTYTNSTGRPIQVAVTSAGTPTANHSFVVAGVTVTSQLSYGTSASQISNTTVIVPAGATYSMTLVSGALNTWTELR